jgi:DNA topoisomerase-1
VTEPVRVYAGECTVTYHGNDEPRTQRGRVVVVYKPDDTVLVHDSEGYQPVEWLTRASAVHLEQTEDGEFALVAVKESERLRVESEGDSSRASHGATPAGTPVGTCPDCDGSLVRARGAVTCLDCPAEYGLPRDAAMLDSACGCGLPRMAVVRGERFDLCVDRDCEDLDAAVRERFDREWACPDCEADLRVLRERTLFLGCENYPNCEETFALPDGEIAGTCDCGLPEVGIEIGREIGTLDDSACTDESRCLDPNCEETPETGKSDEPEAV